MTHRFNDPFCTPRRLSQSVVQAAAMLGLVRAELGRILGYKCEQFSALFEGRSVLEPGTEAYHHAEQFVQLYQALYDYTDGNEALMNHWLRRHNNTLGNSPFYLIIDEGKLPQVLEHLLQIRA